MIQGLYAAANGMMAVEERQAIIANNIANVTTPGFKRQLAVQRGYYESFDAGGSSPRKFDLEIAPGGGIRTVESFTNFGNGVVMATGGAMDVALIGPGFLKVQGEDGLRFTRSGRLSIGPGGQLITLSGLLVLDDNDEPIDVSGGDVGFDDTGNVIVNGEVRARLGIIEFDNPHALQRDGYTLYRAGDDVLERATQAASTTVAPHSLENSNVQLPAEMANMMMALRAYAANQQVIQSINETTGRFISQVGGVN